MASNPHQHLVSEDIALERLESLLREPRESLDVEHKRWLDLDDSNVRGKLAREFLALANHGGGFVVFGMAERQDGTGFDHEGTACPVPARYSQDEINSLIKKFANPAFNARVEWLKCPSGCKDPHVVVLIPGGHRLPIVSSAGGPEPNPNPRKGLIYVRRPGPESSPAVTPSDWESLLNRCLAVRSDELVNSFKAVLDVLGRDGLAEAVGPATPGPEEQLRTWADDCRARLQQRIEAVGVNPYPNGGWSVAYAVGPELNLTMPELRRAMESAIGRETGWPAWNWRPIGDSRDPRPVGDVVECWMQGGHMSDPAHSDFWRASPAGQLYLFRGYDEDALSQLSPQHSGVKPGSMLAPAIVVWRVGECLLHAARFAAQVGGERVRFLVEWTGLSGRTLGATDHLRHHWPASKSVSDEASGYVDVDAGAIDTTLAELVEAVTASMFSQFEFFEMPRDVIVSELERMRRPIDV